jgi:hypothetical protein
MPGPFVHFRLTMQWAIEEGLSEPDAELVGRSSLLVDELWPGSRKPLRHFNPTASLLLAPMESRRAVAFARAGDREQALTHLGYSLHSRQDAIGHGRLGLNHLVLYTGLPFRDPDVWETMPPSVQARIERATRRELRRFIARAAPVPASAPEGR